MGFPEKDPKDELKKRSDAPKLDAILPDDTPPSAAELVDDIATYQQRMEKEWESAKNAYEKKINHIMNEFVSRGVVETRRRNRTRRKNRRCRPPNRRANPAERRLQDLIQQLEKELRGMPRNAPVHAEFLSSAGPVSLQLGWKNSPLAHRRTK